MHVKYTLFGAVLLALPVERARADVPPIRSSNYSLDLFQGPVTTASRVIGLAGAYSALAEWCEGEYSNAAAPAVRAPYSLGTWDYDICLGFTNPGAFAGNDFENRGPDFQSLPTRFSNSVTINAGLEVQYGAFGVTVVYDQIRFGLESVDVNQASDSVVINRVTGSIASAFLDEQLMLGVGFRAATFELDQQVAGNNETLLSSGGASMQLGAVLAPKRSPFRLGATLRTELDVGDIHGTSQLQDGSQVVDGKILPSRIILPWEIEVGGALELGRRPLNRPRLDTTHAEDAIRARYEAARLARAEKHARAIAAAPEKARDRVRRGLELEELDAEAREDAAMKKELDALVDLQKSQARLWDRREMLLLLGVLVTGNTPNAVGISDFLAQRDIRSGENIVVSPRLAFETEAIRDWLKLRGGTYFEPARYADAFSREHFTAGLDIRLFKFNPWGLFGDDPWQIRLAGDLAARYFNYGISLGKYH
ncbi:MAG TPA: hypothetical protein VGH28_19945 [Polyangiaceae bacterium]|jgi:hypothetical protein